MLIAVAMLAGLFLGMLIGRADSQRLIALAAGGVGVGLATYAVVRWLSGGKESKSVAIVPGPGSVGVYARW